MYAIEPFSYSRPRYRTGEQPGKLKGCEISPFGGSGKVDCQREKRLTKETAEEGKRNMRARKVDPGKGKNQEGTW